MRKIREEIRDLKNEMEEKSDLLNLSYDRLANGSRYHYNNKRIDPDCEAAIRKLFDLKTMSSQHNTGK